MKTAWINAINLVSDTYRLILVGKLIHLIWIWLFVICNLILGTKSDMRKTDPHSCVSKTAIFKMVKEINATFYVECSAKNNENVSDVFDAALTAILKNP